MIGGVMRTFIVCGFVVLLVAVVAILTDPV